MNQPPSRPRGAGLRVALLAVLTLVLVVPASAAGPRYEQRGDTAQVVGCTTDTRRVAPGIYLQSFSGPTKVTGGVAGSPPRATLEVTPGKATSTCVGFINRTGGPIKLHLDAIDVASGRPGQAPISLEADSPFGVSDWLDVPDTDPVSVAHGQVLWVVTTVRVPEDATAGSHYAAVQGQVIGDPEIEAPAQVSAGIGVQVFFTIPGDAAGAGEVIDARAPRVVWWDGLELGRLPVLERLRGLGVATIRFSWRNTGDFTDEVGGRIVFESDLGDRDVAELPVGKTVVLREGEREFERTWSKDIPIIGRFTPTIEMRGTDGETSIVKLDPIWVIPSWTYLLALLLAVGLPLWWRRRSQRRYRALLERVEAAEARGSGDQGDAEEWDDDSWRDQR